MQKKDSSLNPWTENDEKEHFPSVTEWWAVEAFFKTKERIPFSLKVAFVEWIEKTQKIASKINITLFNQETNKFSEYYSINADNKLISSKKGFYIQYENSSIKGSYPKYQLHIKNSKNALDLKADLYAQSYPHWVAQEVTDGWLPMGLGFYRYGFIPRLQLIGTMSNAKTTTNITGQSYFEHVWGDFLYDNPFQNISGLKKTIVTYASLISTWVSSQTPQIPSSISFASENNPFGYDWVWALFDNGWSIFYGNSLFWIMDGPAMGSLILTKDGKTYQEFYNIRFHYHKTRWSKTHDFIYPTDLAITARNNHKVIYLKCQMTNEPREYINTFSSNNKFWSGLTICEAPGSVEGYYLTQNSKIPLTGVCKIEPQRQISKLGHNMLKINVITPPKGIGINCFFETQLLKKYGLFNLQLTRKPHIKLQVHNLNTQKNDNH